MGDCQMVDPPQILEILTAQLGVGLALRRMHNEVPESADVPVPVTPDLHDPGLSHRWPESCLVLPKIIPAFVHQRPFHPVIGHLLLNGFDAVGPAHLQPTRRVDHDQVEDDAVE